jgi:hypothetical protein
VDAESFFSHSGLSREVQCRFFRIQPPGC